MVKALYAKAKGSIASIVKPKYTSHQLAIVFTDDHNVFQLILAKDESRLEIAKGAKVVPSAVSLLKEALPLFNRILNVDDVRRCNGLNFIDHQVKYEIVRICFHNLLTLPGAPSVNDSLTNNGFTIVPVHEHRLKDKLIPKIGRP
jgi:hypothetical protein